MLRKRGQSTLEYVIILTAVVAGIIFAATSFLQPRVQDSIEHVSNEMQDSVNRINY